MTGAPSDVRFATGPPDKPPYPPEPWHLGGRLLIGAFRVPVAALPGSARAHAPASVRWLTLGGDAIVAVAFAGYAPGGVLAYDELLVAVVGRAGPRPVVSIGQIWVDSPISMAGGRELWSIPKDLGMFHRHEGSGRIEIAMRTTTGAPVAELQARIGRRLAPGRPRIPLCTAQRLDGREVLCTNVILTRVTGLESTWRFAEEGPLGWLVGRRPIAGLALLDSAIVFAQRVRRRPTAVELAPTAAIPQRQGGAGPMT